MAEISVTTPRGVALSGTLDAAEAGAGTSADPADDRSETAPARAVLFAHGFLADRTSRGRTDGLAKAYRSAGYATLAFDFGGHGDSGDDVVEVSHEVEDLEAASAHLAAAGYGHQVVHAHSMGALVALRAGSPHVRAMVLTGAVSGPVEHPWEEVLSPAKMAELTSTGRTTVLDDGPSGREELEISEQTLADFTEVDQAELLGTVACPVLMLHGGALVGGEEHPLLTQARIGLPLLPEGSRLEVLSGGEHALLDRTEEVAARALTWLGELGS
ncbi:alpha/beta hydrolase [Actinotalea sp. C106]|uniref:alpha/beta hydrolase n=1 Tax=Actinotalea sp. C106 TaxID=2908644 RepID=UPI002028DDD9|nr:alpha/beta fold hydrolase [Actinotalea sp. C106]